MVLWQRPVWKSKRTTSWPPRSLSRCLTAVSIFEWMTTPTRLLKIRWFSESHAPGGDWLPNLEEFRDQCPVRVHNEQTLGSDWVHAADRNDAAHVSQHPWKCPAALLLHQLQHELSDNSFRLAKNRHFPIQWNWADPIQPLLWGQRVHLPLFASK